MWTSVQRQREIISVSETVWTLMDPIAATVRTDTNLEVTAELVKVKTSRAMMLLL